MENEALIAVFFGMFGFVFVIIMCVALACSGSGGGTKYYDY